MYISTCSKSSHKFFILTATAADIEPPPLLPSPPRKNKINNKVDFFSCLTVAEVYS